MATLILLVSVLVWQELRQRGFWTTFKVFEFEFSCNCNYIYLILSAQLQRDNRSRDEPASINVQNWSSGEFHPPVLDLPLPASWPLHAFFIKSKPSQNQILKIFWIDDTQSQLAAQWTTIHNWNISYSEKFLQLWKNFFLFETFLPTMYHGQIKKKKTKRRWGCVTGQGVI
jgi:hypothetical protein